MFASRRGIVTTLFFGWIAGFPAGGQQPAPAPAAPATAANAPEMATREAPATFSTRVNLVMVPVVVRDSAGKAVGTLKQEDFQLFDKGKPQIILKFSIEKPGTPTIPAETAIEENAEPGKPAAPAPPIADRFVAYLFDDVHINTSDLLRVRLAATRHLDEIETTTRVAVFTTSGRTTLDFTGDRDQVRDTLNRIQPWTSSALTPNDCPQVSYYQADQIINHNDQTALNAAIADALSCQPPQQDQNTALQLAQLAANSAAHLGLDVGDEETRVSMKVMQDAIRRITAAPGSRSLILVSPGFFLTFDHRSEENDILDRAIRGNVVISTLNAHGVYNPDPATDVSQRLSGPPSVNGLKRQFALDSAAADEDILGELASGTGGTYFFNNNDLVQGFHQVAARPEFVYVLGFSPQNLKYDGSYHTVKVAVKNPRALNLQARRGYFAPKHEIDPEQEAKEEIREALFSREEMTELPVDLNLQFFKSSDYNARLSVMARVHIKQLRFRKAEDRNLDNLTILSGIFDRNGNFINGIQKVVEMKLRDQTLAVLPEAGINVRTNFDLAPGAYVVRLVVRDSEGHLMAAKNGSVQIP